MHYSSNLLKTLILEGQEADLPDLYPRALEIPLDSTKPIIIAGMRRVGKSSLCILLQQRLLSELKVHRQQICSINFVDERIRPLNKNLLTELEQAYRELYPESYDQLVYWFFDEIHLVPEWEYFIDRLSRKKNNQLIITGSSAKLSSSEIASSMRGRPLVYELFPFSLPEILSNKELASLPVSPRTLPKINKIANDYLTIGGFPETLDAPKAIRYKIHGEYYRAVILRDIFERHAPRDPRLIESVFKELTSQVGLLTSFNRIQNRLEATGSSVSLSSVLDILSWAEEAYYLYHIELLSESLQKRRVNPKKLYAIDSGLLNSISDSLNQNFGRLFENMVFNHLRQKYKDVYYYKTKKDYEVDFVVKNGKNHLLIQAALELSDFETRRRELRALEEAMRELEIHQAFVLTQQLDEEYSFTGGTILITPAWKFFLNPPL